MADVCVQLGSSIEIFGSSLILEAQSAVVAEAGTQMVFFMAPRAAIAKQSAWHRDEHALFPLDDLQVSDDEASIQGDGGKSTECFMAFYRHDFDAYIGNTERGFWLRKTHDGPRLMDTQ